MTTVAYVGRPRHLGARKRMLVAHGRSRYVSGEQSILLCTLFVTFAHEEILLRLQEAEVLYTPFVVNFDPRVPHQFRLLQDNTRCTGINSLEGSFTVVVHHTVVCTVHVDVYVPLGRRLSQATRDE